MARVKATFAGTRWQTGWEQVGAPETLIAARVTLFRSKRRNNDAFQIAVEFLHLAILGVLALSVVGTAFAEDSDNAFRNGLTAFNDGQYERAQAAWRPLADAGDTRAQASIRHLTVCFALFREFPDGAHP